MSNELLDLFFNYIKFEKRLSELTIKNYQHDINRLIKLNDKKLTEINSEDIRLSLSKLHASGLSGKSLSRILSSWRGCFLFLNKSQLMKYDPTSGIKAPKAKKKLPQTLSIDQVFNLINIPQTGFIDTRDKAILEFFYSSGLRLSELVNIHISDIDMSEQTLKVLGKGNKFRIVPIGRKAIEALNLWILQRNKLNKILDSELLFLNQHGKKLTARAIQYRLKFWAQKNNIPENIHPHLLRHSFASHVLQSSQDLRAVQELLGHSNISTTQIYTHLDFQHLSKIYDQAHPRSKKKID
ncbi:MAG: tyrosine recombinase XerC [Betaproteobacteria bacterium]|jgi:integrase/recombinase XerC|nr:tyrosine recombinase XerC [Nitrosomonadales bacterium]NCV38369.1 tyrosine recombinase XerC [Betaproteobacteria bacterium]NCV53363.1 tyrosine recombinase XerC [Betaproteobacteria bacterium]